MAIFEEFASARMPEWSVRSPARAAPNSVRPIAAQTPAVRFESSRTVRRNAEASANAAFSLMSYRRLRAKTTSPIQPKRRQAHPAMWV